MFTKVISQTLLYIYVYHVIVNVIFEENYSFRRIFVFNLNLYKKWMELILRLLIHGFRLNFVNNPNLALKLKLAFKFQVSRENPKFHVSKNVGSERG